MMPAPDAKRIGEWLQQARERHNKRVRDGAKLAPDEAKVALSQEQAAPLVGTTARTMGSWERGETVPPADQFLALVFMYGADLMQFLARRFSKEAATGGTAVEPERKRRLG